MAFPLYRLQELSFRTQYAEVKERSRAAGKLSPGTPGRLVLRTGTGYGYWYRGYYSVPGQEVEDFVCKEGDDEALQAAKEQIEFADWSARQVRDLRKLEFQVADKAAARVLVELHNAGLFESGLVLVGTLCYMAWLNELGAKAVAARTQDIDLARRKVLKLATPLPFLGTIEATKMKFSPVPGMPSHAPSTSVTRPGANALRIDILADGPTLGRTVAIPELEWHAQTVPFYDYLLSQPREACLLAGGHCVPVKLPAPERLLWLKVYASTNRSGDPEKAPKDLLQAATLAAILVEQDGASLRNSLRGAPDRLKSAALARRPALSKLLEAHPEAAEQLERAVQTD
ncbi:MAG: GSU2403 family nucleotidyltransferase fold protein [Caldimonas sp.]